MRTTFPALLALCLAVSAEAAMADDAPRTVSDYADAMNASASQIDQLVTDRQKAGDMAVAQRLVLAAAMVRRTADEFRNAEQDALTNDASSLPAPVPALLAAAVAEAAKAETSAADAPGFVDEAQHTFNALLAAVQMKTPHPVFYGALASDLSTAPLPSDVVIYGFRLIDPLYKTQPDVFYKRTEIPSVVVKDDRIEVTLPDDVKKIVDFAPSPCDSRASFGLRVRDTFAEQHGFWPIYWHTQVMTTTDLYVLPSSVFYSAKIVTSTQSVSAALSTVPFDQRSQLATADCNETRKFEVTTTLPAGAANVICAGEWQDASGATSTSSRCVNDGHALHLVGELTGGPKVCSPEKLCTCPSFAQGFLDMKGSYQIESAEHEVKIADEAKALSFAAGGSADGDVTVEAGQKLRHVALSISRRACPTAVDSIDLNIGDDPEGKAAGVSKTGAFRAAINGKSLRVGSADAFAPDIDKLP